MGGGYCLTRQLGNLRYLGCQPKVILCTLTLCYNNNITHCKRITICFIIFVDVLVHA